MSLTPSLLLWLPGSGLWYVIDVSLAMGVGVVELVAVAVAVAVACGLHGCGLRHAIDDVDLCFDCGSGLVYLMVVVLAGGCGLAATSVELVAVAAPVILYVWLALARGCGLVYVIVVLVLWMPGLVYVMVLAGGRLCSCQSLLVCELA